MKTAIYVEDGITQIVLTPATAFEREVLARISREEIVHVRVAKGSFRPDQEGWQRFGTGLDGEPADQCLMLRLGSEGSGSPAVSGEGLNLDGLASEVPLQVDGTLRHAFRPQDL